MSSQQESNVQRLERLLQEQRQRAEEAEQRAEEERRRADEERHRAEEERHRAQGVDERIRQTSFKECLYACHSHLHNPLSVERDKRLTTKGFTSPKNKLYPQTLCPWEDFTVYQQQAFDEAYGFFHPPGQSALRCLNSIQYLEELGQNLCRRKLASEADLETYERTAVEDMVTRIISQLCEMKPARTQLQLGQGVVFDNHINSLSDAAEEVQQYLHIRTPRANPQPPSSSSSSSTSDSKPTRTRADQFCVFKNADGIRKLLLVVEYKPPHKLSVGNLQAGFRPMKIEDILTAATIPNGLEDRLQYNADKLAAAVATQTFHYMVENGLEFSYITTGEAFVFLHVKREDPTTLYYHLTVPGDEIENLKFQFSQTAISQVMSLCLMAFQSQQMDHRWRRNARNKLKRYKVDYEAILRQIPETERKLSPVSIYQGRKTANHKASPYFTRLKAQKEKAKAKTRTSCDVDKPSFSDDGQSDPDTPSRPPKGRLQAVNKTKGKDTGTENERSNADSHTGSMGKQHKYCTQGCLWGLVRGVILDERCPNLSLHPRHADRHAIDMQEFTRLVRKQLKEDLDNNCEPLGLQGARGALFRLTLASHGYVFVGKGTVRAFVGTLLWEGRIYQKLWNLHGTAVPVYLGNIQLAHRYYLDVGVRISHMLLMSWGGAMVEETVDGKEIKRTVEAVRNEGVDQGDIRTANLLWNEEMQRVMLIDFERATFLNHSIPKIAKDVRVLQSMSPNKKRKRAASTKEGDIDTHSTN